MQMSACCRDVAVSERRLDFRQAASALNRMRAVGVPQPVRCWVDRSRSVRIICIGGQVAQIAILNSRRI
jgi:hypothetical protein